jgi:hypothetical protein
MADREDPKAASLEDRHESETAADGSKTVKYAFAFRSLDWDAYHAHRPVYPESMWRMWVDYHRSHGGKFDEAHDIGAGKSLQAPHHLHKGTTAALPG